jgi:hypothetical protein
MCYLIDFEIPLVILVYGVNVTPLEYSEAVSMSVVEQEFPPHRRVWALENHRVRLVFLFVMLLLNTSLVKRGRDLEGHRIIRGS